jgi:hypothetical protein
LWLSPKNAALHTAGATLAYLSFHRIKGAFHPPFPPDLARFDFSLFGKLKTTLMGDELGDERQLLDKVMRGSIRFCATNLKPFLTNGW